MIRSITVLAAGLVVGVGAYLGLYFAGTSSRREMLHSQTPELLWLKNEFNLSDAEFERVSRLHDGYLPQCTQMCARIAAKDAELKALLSQTNVLTAEIEAKLTEASQLRLECQKNMLKHFYEVSRTMKPDQGKRYLAWVQEKTFLPDHGMAGEQEAGQVHEHAAER
ncbi:MAG: periplasmic heavy metal sensor [Verrucomicrobia bacterium]|nr:periplasmic heavy metal sensor [Verrucomicrobiota bacterium]